MEIALRSVSKVLSVDLAIHIKQNLVSEGNIRTSAFTYEGRLQLIDTIYATSRDEPSLLVGFS